MRKELIDFALVVLFSLAQAPSVSVKVENHLLGESAEHFFSEGHEGEILTACAAGDFAKGNRLSKKLAKEYCAWLSSVRQRLVSGESGKYADGLSTDDTKTTNYVFMTGKFVAAEIIFTAPDATNNCRGEAFAEIFAGLKGTYGPPTSETLVPYQNVYGVHFERHQELWLAESYAIQTDEQPGASGWTSVNVWTREEYDKLKSEKATKPPSNPLN
jgi:hypothetical protein